MDALEVLARSLPNLQPVELLEPWQGGLLLRCGLLAALLGTVLAVRRDVVCPLPPSVVGPGAQRVERRRRA